MNEKQKEILEEVDDAAYNIVFCEWLGQHMHALDVALNKAVENNCDSVQLSALVEAYNQFQVAQGGLVEAQQNLYNVE